MTLSGAQSFLLKNWLDHDNGDGNMMWVLLILQPFSFVVISSFFNLHLQNLEHGHDDAGEHIVPTKHLLGGAAQDALHWSWSWLYQGARHKCSCGGEGILSLTPLIAKACVTMLHHAENMWVVSGFWTSPLIFYMFCFYAISRLILHHLSPVSVSS